ncbi:MAG TPA: hypothetical protein DHB48_09980 [Sphingobium sp.]|nr:hypothetical protein [Sphingobium sp.]
MRHVIIMAGIALISACSAGEKAKEPTQREQIGQSWKYEEAEGTKLAYVGSANSVATMTAPDTFSVLLVQPMSNGEKTVRVKLVGAPFRCDLSDCAVTARADGGEPMEWKGRMTTTDDGIELPPSQKAYEAIKAARTIDVDLITGTKDETTRFRFNVAGLDLPS